MTEQLKPCPFCGGEAKLSHGEWEIKAGCNVCDASVAASFAYNKSPEDSVRRRWNARARTEDENKLLQALGGSLEVITKLQHNISQLIEFAEKLMNYHDLGTNEELHDAAEAAIRKAEGK